ncbi:MAG: Fur family transcriptional regulator [Rhizobiaceae bacterium]|nr:Fur family transcriptional regulator [Rhizobiaceae bacterium]
MTKHTHDVSDLTKNQALVMNALSSANGPLSAYTILDELREHGFRAPLQVYRALDKLVEFGLVHRLESLNAFVACRHPSCEGESKEAVLFTICEKCGNVQELISESVVKSLKGLAEEIEFSLKESVIELRGICTDCKAA